MKRPPNPIWLIVVAAIWLLLHTHCSAQQPYGYRVDVRPRPIWQYANPRYETPTTIWVPRRVGLLGWRVRWYPIPRNPQGYGYPQAGGMNIKIQRPQ